MWLSDTQLDELCDGISREQKARRCKFLRGLGLRVVETPSAAGAVLERRGRARRPAAGQGPEGATGIERCAAGSRGIGRAFRETKEGGSVTDRELLERAAKVAGITLRDNWGNFLEVDERGCCHCWFPLSNDAQALRLAVKLGIGVSRSFNGKRVEASHRDLPWTFYEDLTRDDATRRAIVRAAAALA